MFSTSETEHYEFDPSNWGQACFRRLPPLTDCGFNLGSVVR
jgi:hypothetical protein